MKEFITGIATLLLLSVFLVQFTTNQVTHDKLLFVQKDIEAYLQDVKQEGYFSEEIKENLEIALAEDLKQNGEGAITIESDCTEPVERGELIPYKITIVLKNVIGAANFLGSDIDEIEKTYSGYVASEYVE